MTTSSILADLLQYNPSSLAPESASAARNALLALYERYGRELLSLTIQMAPQRQRMLEAGYAATFGDRESELLYLLVRETHPTVVVEIAPCHGYSTNYLLAGLRDNGSGVLHSYEIATEVRGAPIEKVIRGNLLPDLPQDRLHLHVGDARQQDIPPADVLFIDASHETHFASWLFKTQVPRAGWVFQHDLVAREAGTLTPKAWSLGPREAGTTLELLRLNGQRLFPVAAALDLLASHPSDLVPRFPDWAVSILYQGRPLAGDAAHLANSLALIHERRLASVQGLREATVHDTPTDLHFYGRCAYGVLLSELGYTSGRLHAVPHYQEHILPTPRGELSASELVAYLEYLQRSAHVPGLLRLALAPSVECAHRPLLRLVRRGVLRALLLPESGAGPVIPRPARLFHQLRRMALPFVPVQ